MIFKPHSQSTKKIISHPKRYLEGYLHNYLQFTYFSTSLGISLALSKHAELRKLCVVSNIMTISIQQQISSQRTNFNSCNRMEINRLSQFTSCSITIEIPLWDSSIEMY